MGIDIDVIGNATKSAVEAFNELVPGFHRWMLRRANSKDFKQDLKDIDEALASTSLSETVKDSVKLAYIEKAKGIDNTMNAVAGALPLVDPGKAGNVSAIDEDWMDFFADKTSRVSDESVRGTWSKLLAGEIEKPGSYSRRDMEVLSMMGSREAHQFEQVCAYAIQVDLLEGYDSPITIIDLLLHRNSSDSTYFNGRGCSMLVIAELESIGLLTTTIKLRPFMPPKGKVFITAAGKRYTVANPPDMSTKLSLSAEATFTGAGRSLARLCDIGGGKDLPVILEQSVREQGLQLLTVDAVA